VSPFRHRAGVAALVAAAIALPAAIPALSSAATGPPPTPVPPKGSLSPFPSVLATPSDAEVAPVLTAPVGLLANLDDGQVLFAKGVDRARPIASLTKVMTALLVLERTNLDDVVTVSADAVFAPKDYGADSILGLKAGERLSVRDLLYGLLLGSANDAAVALAIDVSGSPSAFVALMNQRAKRLGMHHTAFFSPSGLDDRGHSTAEDLLRLTRAAFAAPGFAPIVATRVRRIPGPGDHTRTIQNRDAMLWLYPGAIGVKTGSTTSARYCLIAAAKRDGRTLLAVVLGAPSDAFSDAAALLDYGFAAFAPRTFVHAGDHVGRLAIRGGMVPVVAGGTIRGLVPRTSIDHARTVALAEPHVAFPVAPGTRVGILRVAIPGRIVGTVPLRAGAIAVPVPDDAHPWWMRAAGAVGRAVGSAVSGLMG
jgi:D-alanyl-D-alanine carboxypeptidase (penicillin-binding protein 5/6)